MDANRCVSCGVIITEDRHVCTGCLPDKCVGCGWENAENRRACRGQNGDNKNE